MTQSEEIHRLIDGMEKGDFTSTEFAARMMEHLRELPLAERQAALDELSPHANEDVRVAASELKMFMRYEQLSKNLDYVRQHSPLRPGMRLELFGGYD